MLSIARRGSASSTRDYLLATSSDYYMNGSDERITENYGNGLDSIGQGSEFTESAFAEMLNGKFGDQLVGRPTGQGELEHMPGWDLTFSAPKSVSILALEGGDSRLIGAHLAAVKAAMKYVEDNKTFFRSTKDNSTTLEKGNGIIASLFTHTTSRELDPALHTHTFLQNVTFDEQGVARSIESKPIFKAKMLVGMIYRSELAHNIKQLGYDIDITNNQKLLFEISGVPKHVIDAKSKRRAQILEAAEKFGIKSSKQMEVATLMTRGRKRNMSAEMLKERWNDENELLGFSPSEFIKDNSNFNSKPFDKQEFHTAQPSDSFAQFSQEVSIEEAKRLSALSDVRLAYQALAVNDAAFAHDTLIMKAMTLGVGSHTEHDYNQSISTLVDNGELVTHPDGYTTSNAVEVETRILTEVAMRHQTYSPLASQDYIDEKIADYNATSKYPTNEGQRLAVESVFTSDSAVSLIQGWAGVGKTTVQRLVKSIADDLNMDVVGIGPTGSAAETLFRETNIESKTLASHIFTRGRYQRAANNEIWLLDESSLANADEFLSLIELSNKLGSRLVLLGDKSQHHSVEWGNVFSQLQNIGVPTAQLTQIFRQLDPAYREAVISAAEGRITESMDILSSSIKEGGFSQLLDHVSTMAPDDYKSTQFVIPSIKDRDNVSEAIRERLIELDTIQPVYTDDSNSERVSAYMLRSAQMNRITQSDSRFYENDLVIQFQSDKLGFPKNSLWQVSSTDRKDNTLLLTDLKNPNTQVTFSLDSVSGDNESRYDLSVYKRINRDIALGDNMIWKKSDNSLGLVNGAKGIVSAVDVAQQTYTVDFGDTSMVLPLNDETQPQHIDWNYANTSYIAQGTQNENVVLWMDSSQKYLTNQQTFYVGISRGQIDAQIFTDSKSSTLDLLLENTGVNSTAIHSTDRLQNLFKEQMTIKDYVSRNLLQSPSEAAASKDIQQAIYALTERKGIFTSDDLINHALKNGFSNASFDQLNNTINNLRSTNRLSFVGSDERKNVYLASSIQLKQEGAFSSMARAGIGRRTKIIGKNYLTQHVNALSERAIEKGEPLAFRPQHYDALASILSSKDEMVIWKGKSDDVRELASHTMTQIATTQGYGIRAFHNSNKQKEDLQKLGFSKLGSVMGFSKFVEDKLASGEHFNFTKEIWFIDNASSLSIKDLTSLVRTARATGARLVLSETDDHPMQGGRAIDVLSSQGIASTSLTNRIENQDKQLAQTKYLIEQNQFDKAFDVLKESIVELPGDNKDSQEARLKTLTTSYLSLSDKEKSHTNVVIQDRKTRDMFNVSVRDSLRKKGQLSGDSVTLFTKRSDILTPFEKLDSRYYTVGHSIVFAGEKVSDEGATLSPKQTYRILEKNTATNKLVLQDSLGNVHTWSPETSTFSRTNSHEVFSKVPLDFMKGDRVRVGESVIGDDRKFVAKSGDFGIVESVRNDSIDVKMRNGHVITLSTENNHKIEYGYSMSQFASKGNHAEKTLALLDSKKSFSVTKENLSDLLANTKHQLCLVVDSKDKIMTILKKQPNPPKSALAARQILAAKDSKSYISTAGFALSKGDRFAERLNGIVKSAADKLHEQINRPRPEPVNHIQQQRKQNELGL